MSDKKTIKWINSKMKGNRLKMAALLIFCVISSAITVALAIFVKEIINNAVDFNKKNIIIFSIALISAIAFQFILTLLNNFLKEKIRFSLEIKLKQDLFDIVLKKDYANITAYHSGDLLNRMFSDNAIIAEIMSGLLPSLVSMASKLIFAFALLFSMAFEFTLMLLVGGILVICFSILFKKAMKKLHKATQEADGKVRAFMQESTENILAVKVFSNENKVSGKAKKLQEVYYDKRIKQRKLFIFANSTLNFAFSLAYIFALIYGAFGIFNKFLDYGTISAMLQLVTQIQSPLTSLGGIFPQYYNMLASAERIIEIEEISTEKNETNLSDVGEFYNSLKSVSVTNLTFKYNRDTIFENANLTINKGDFICIKGISGIGKSTLLKLLLGVFPSYSGEILFNTNNGNYKADKGLRPLFAYVPQGNLLFSGTLRDNICFINETATEQEIETALKLSCSETFIRELPNGLETMIGESGLGLSEGQMQRIAIARALLVSAPILLLDEATSALDEATEAELLKNLKTLKDITLIIISHKSASQKICDRKIEIVDKKIIEGEDISNGIFR